MAGYLGLMEVRGFGRSQAGYSSQYDRPTGIAYLARDVTALEESDRGWRNLPPWGYARGRSSTFAPTLSGLGCCAGLGCLGIGTSPLATAVALGAVGLLGYAVYKGISGR